MTSQAFMPLQFISFGKIPPDRNRLPGAAIGINRMVKAWRQAREIPPPALASLSIGDKP
jgi:hypothetical protein